MRHENLPVLIADGVVAIKTRFLHNANNEVIALYTKTLKLTETLCSVYGEVSL